MKNLKSLIKNSNKLKNKGAVIFIVLIAVVFTYTFLKESIVTNIAAGYAVPNTVVNSVVVALDGALNPNGIIAAASDITQKVESGEGIIVKDVFKRCKIQSDNRVSDGFYQPYDTKAGVNNGDTIQDGNGGNDIRQYLRYDNRSSLDLEASQNVVILMKGTGPSVVASAIRNINEQGMVAIIRLGVIDMGDFPFDFTNNADEMSDFFIKVGDELMKEDKGWKAVISLGPNEPTTGGKGEDNVPAILGVDYTTMVQRENQAADRLQPYRVINGGPFWLAPAIFNGTAALQKDGREYSQDVYKHLYNENGDTDTSKQYITVDGVEARKSIDPDLFDVMLANIYKNVAKTSYNFYKEFGLKEYVDKRPGLVTIVTEFGIDPFSPSLVTADLKPDIKEFLDDPKVEGVNWFRALKDKPAQPPAPTPEQSASLEDFVKFHEQSSKSTKKISLKNFSWVNCKLGTTITISNNTSGNSTGGTLNPTSKGGLNNADNVPGNAETLTHATNVGLQGYALAIAYNSGDAGATINYIKEAQAKGYIPIVRLCVNEGTPCGFNLTSNAGADDMASFYNQITADPGVKSFIGIVGPNEPTTESHVFGGATLNQAIQNSIQAVIKINKNGKMLATPTAFNFEIKDEFKAYESALTTGKYDVLIGNAYNRASGTAADIAKDGIDFAKSHNMKIIITETGTINESGAADFVSTAADFCSKVDGFLLFRVTAGSGDGSYDLKPKAFSDDQLKAIATACGGGAPSSPTQTVLGINSSSVLAVNDNGGGGSPTTPTPANSCTGGIADGDIIFLGDSLTNELVSKNFSASKNLGFPGASAAWLVPGAEPANDRSGELNTALGDSKYKAIVVEFGTNDCGGVDINVFKQNLTTIVNNIKNKNSSIKIVLSTIPRAHKACSASVIDGYNNAIKEVVQATGVTSRELGGSIFSEADLRDGDDRHLKDDAYAKIADITRQALGATCSTTSNPTSGTSSGGNAGSFALSCGVEDDKPADFYKGANAAGLRVKCQGESCTTQKVGTLEVEAPVKLFVNNSPNGTMRLRYIPVSQVAASQSSIDGYDALNMYAGELKFGSKSYPMPGLGSAINSSYQLLSATMTGGEPNRFLNSSDQSRVKWTENKLKIQSEADNTIGIVGEMSTGGYTTNAFSIEDKDNGLKSIDERAVTFDGLTFNNDAGLADYRKNIFPYDPSVAFPSYIAPKACQASSMKYINNLDNYVTGPEMVVESKSTVTTNTTQDICWMYAGRSLPGRNPVMTGDGVKTCGYIFDTRIFGAAADVNALSSKSGKPLHETFETVYDPTLGRNVQISHIERGNWTCQELFVGHAIGDDGVDEDPQFKNEEVKKELPDCDFDDYLYELSNPKGKIDSKIRSGRCDIPPEYKSCLKYIPQDSDQIYIHTESYPAMSKVRVPGAYSALYGLYDRLQTIMSNRSMKFVFQENYGMKFKINTKIRDANETINEIPYDFSTVYDSYTQPELIDNKIPLASTNPTKTQFQYFDDLGYLDILQEYIVAYGNEQVLIGDNVIDNPFDGTGLNPLPGRDKIVVGGKSNLTLANPVLTCDQLEICKDYTFDDLKGKFGEEKAFALCPLKEKLPSDSKKNCITFDTDERYIDRLKTTLCSRGYPVSEGCNFQCSEGGANENPTTPGGPGEGNPPINGKYAGTACPVADNSHRCFQGPFGTYTHLQSGGLPLDLYPAFTGGSAASGRDKRVVAPEDGTVTGVTNNGSQGYAIALTGKSGINYKFLHLNGNDTKMVRSGDVKGGQYIAEIASQATVPGLAYDDSNIHTHIRAEYNGNDIDPYYLFGQILGCHAIAPDPSWSPNTDITSLVSNPTMYCVKSHSIGGGKYQFLLNDTPLSKTNGTKPGAGDNDTNPISNAIVKGLFDTAYGSPSSGTSGTQTPTPTQSLMSPSKTIVVASSAPRDLVLAASNVSGPSVLGVDTGVGMPSITDFKIRIPSDEDVVQFSPYGNRCYDKDGSRVCNFHTGQDYSLNSLTGTPVVASESGLVIKVGWDPLGYGNYVRILHPNGYSTLYGHNSSVTVKEGDCVIRGQEIAKAGSTGNSTGPHIHLEVRKDATCTITDFGPDSKQDCAVNPLAYIDGKGNTSVFTDEQVKAVCKGSLPGGTTPPSDGDKEILCSPTDENENGNPSGNKFYKTVFDLLEKVEQVSGIDKYFLAAILSLESSPQLDTSVGKAITSGGATYTGDPYNVGNETQNKASAVGPFQFICRTAASYFYPKGPDTVPWPVSNSTTSCSSWSNSVGRYYDQVLACVKAIGMDYKDGDILDPKYLGVGACGAAVHLNGVKGQSYPELSNFTSSNIYVSVAGGFNGGGGWQSFPESVWYAQSAWGRANFFKKFWDEYKSGAKGADCSRPYREWYYYHVDLGIQCVSNGYGGQCTVNSKEALDAACNR